MYNLRYQNHDKSYTVEFSKIADNIVQIVGDFPILPDGFFLSRVGFADNWNYTDYSTCYRRIDGGVQFSNDGSVYVEPVHDVEVKAEFDGIEEKAVNVDVFKDGAPFDNVYLSPENSFKRVYEDEPIKYTFSIIADDIRGADKAVEGTTVRYSLPAPYEPSVEEQVAEMFDAIIDLDERVTAIEEG